VPNAIEQNRGTTRTWRASGGNEALTLTSLGAGAGRQGDIADLDTILGDPREYRFNWRFFMKFATTPVVGEIIRIYAKFGDGTRRDNDDGTSDAAVSAEDKLRNLTLLGTLVVDEASSTPEFSIGGEVEISQVEFAPVIWNDTADAFSSTAADHGFDLTPVPVEIQ
jgi:hypothetical protein